MKLPMQNKEEIHFEELSDNDSAALIGGASFLQYVQNIVDSLNLNEAQLNALVPELAELAAATNTNGVFDAFRNLITRVREL